MLTRQSDSQVIGHLTMATLTYAEIAEALKIAPASAYRLALRRHWPRAKGNDGKTRVAVPDEALTRHSDSPSYSHSDSHGDSHSDSHLTIARLEGELKGLHEALVEARARAEQANTQLAAESARADKAIQAFADLADRLDVLAADRARPWWRRLTG
jgi:hypothetical protein